MTHNPVQSSIGRDDIQHTLHHLMIGAALVEALAKEESDAATAFFDAIRSGHRQVLTDSDGRLSVARADALIQALSDGLMENELPHEQWEAIWPSKRYGTTGLFVARLGIMPQQRLPLEVVTHAADEEMTEGFTLSVISAYEAYTSRTAKR